jgi:lipid-A-disaccharide synthase
LRISEYAKKRGIKTFYYISPQVWAWKKNRVHKIKRFVDHMFVILPFEKEFYERYNYEVDYVGHPLLDALENYEFKSKSDFYEEYRLNQKPIIALLPGSRSSEVSRILPKMISAVMQFPDYQFVIAGMSGFDEDYYRQYTGNVDVQIVYSDTYNLLHHAHAAVVASGTATLETAILNTPQVVCYETSTTTYYVARFLVEIKYISLVNLIRDEEVIREIIQGDFNPATLKNALEDILKGEKREVLLEKYEELRKQLGGGGASEKAAQLMHNYATTK